ncbi:MAG: Hsp20/alpha crystallin family protein [Planctomycetota bacterium]|nr:Hsp20/alpha crystallin family protein [Planctomycetota bacterium]
MNATATPPAACQRAQQPVREALRYTPRVDLVETPAELILTADLPGVRADGLQVDFHDGVLSLYGKAPARQAEETRFLLHEYGVGDFRREFRVGEQVDATKIRGELKDGVLTLRLPKAEAARPRRIPVQAS